MEKKIPIYRGCTTATNGEMCYCTGACRQIIGYRDPNPLENPFPFNIQETYKKYEKLSNEVLYELWDNKKDSSFYYIAKNGIIKQIKSLNYDDEYGTFDLQIIDKVVVKTIYLSRKTNLKIQNLKAIKQFDKFVEKHQNTILFRTEQEAKNYLKSLTI